MPTHFLVSKKRESLIPCATASSKRAKRSIKILYPFCSPAAADATPAAFPVTQRCTTPESSSVTHYYIRHSTASTLNAASSLSNQACARNRPCLAATLPLQQIQCNLLLPANQRKTSTELESYLLSTSFPLTPGEDTSINWSIKIGRSRKKKRRQKTHGG